MKHARSEAVEWGKTASKRIDDILIGSIVHIMPDGIAFVDYPDNTAGPIRAESAVSASPCGDIAAYQGAKVLLTFENRNPACPIIIGFVRDTLFPKENPTETKLSGPRPFEVIVDGESVRLDAKEEITLRCGKSCIIMKKDGKVVIRGVEITNRAAGINRIKGGAVRIN